MKFDSFWIIGQTVLVVILCWGVLNLTDPVRFIWLGLALINTFFLGMRVTLITLERNRD